MEQNLNPVISISEKDRARTVNTLLTEKLQVMTIQLAVLLKRNFPNALFSLNVQGNALTLM